MTPKPERPGGRPYWLWQTKRLFPSRIFAGLVSVACVMVGVLCGGVAIGVADCWPMAIPGILFFAGALATACTALAKSNNQFAEDYSRNYQSEKPTLAIMVLLIGIYSWLLSLAMNVFPGFFKNAPGSIKFYVTLAVAISSTLFMQFYGKRVLRECFDEKGARNLKISAAQAVYVVLFLVGCGFYVVWLTG